MKKFSKFVTEAELKYVKKRISLDSVGKPGAYDKERVEHYRSEIRKGKKIPPIHVHREMPHDKHYTVANGAHRLEAHRLEGKKHIDALEFEKDPHRNTKAYRKQFPEDHH